MIPVLRYREFLMELKFAIEEINFCEIIIDDSQFIKFLKERTKDDNVLLFGVLPQYPLEGNEDLVKWVNQFQLFVLLKRSDRFSHDELIKNMAFTQEVVNKIVEFILTNSFGDGNLFCGVANELVNGSLLVYPVWEKAQCDGWSIEFDLRT